MYLELAESRDASKWNDIVEKDKNGLFFDKYEWCQALGKISNNNKPLPFFIRDNDEIVGIFPSCLIKKGFYLGLESLPFSDYGGGPFFRKNDIENDSEGVMQDIHWSSGGFGYFPSYALGNIYSGQILATMEKDISDWKNQISNANFQNIKQWLTKNVHNHGNLYDPPDLIKRITKQELNVKTYLNYLYRKYSKLYGF